MLILEVKGLEPAAGKLSAITMSIAEEIRASFRESGADIVARARARAPGLGTIGASIRSRVADTKQGEIKLTVKRGPRGWKGNFFEFAKKSPTVRVRSYLRGGHRLPSPGKITRRHVGGDQVSAYERRNVLYHRPFMAPAWAEVGPTIQDRVNAAIARAIRA